MSDEKQSTESTPTVRDAGDRYEIVVDGAVAGLTQYLDHGEQRIFFHTEVGERYEGQGLASILVHDALTDTVARGKRIVPICPYVAKYVRRHHDFDDNLDPVTPDAIAAVQSS
ncbi:GNAT family N-acetyltransferase [Rhodococcus olei]|uniref:GNAT family N-acetyltransferase n=1 Tax=Rhodococcus olei TaxID=2161675 RepID=A0ABP8P737_9NOCA